MIKYTNSSPENELKDLIRNFQFAENDDEKNEFKKQINLLKEVINDREKDITTNKIKWW